MIQTFVHSLLAFDCGFSNRLGANLELVGLCPAVCADIPKVPELPQGQQRAAPVCAEAAGPGADWVHEEPLRQRSRGGRDLREGLAGKGAYLCSFFLPLVRMQHVGHTCLQ